MSTQKPTPRQITPGGQDGEVQFNNAGVIDGVSNVSYDPNTTQLSINTGLFTSGPLTLTNDTCFLQMATNFIVVDAVGNEFVLDATHTRFNKLAGTGTRLVTADASGNLGSTPNPAIDSSLGQLQAMGSTIKAFPMGNPVAGNASSGLTANQINLVSVYLPNDATLTGIKVVIAQQGSYTPSGNNQVGLYQVSGTTATLVASSTNSGTLWSTAASGALQTIPFSATFAATAGLYYIAVTYQRSAEVTQPKLNACTVTSANNLMDYTNGNRSAGFIATTNTLPSSFTISTLGNGGTLFWLSAY